MLGSINSVSVRKFAVLTGDDGLVYFLHFSELPAEALPPVVGQVVSFTPAKAIQGARWPRAVRAVVVNREAIKS